MWVPKGLNLSVFIYRCPDAVASTTLCWERRKRLWFARHADKIRRTARGTWDILRCDNASPLLIQHGNVSAVLNGFSVRRHFLESRVLFSHVHFDFCSKYLQLCRQYLFSGSDIKLSFSWLSYLTASAFRFVRPVLAGRACLQSNAIRAVVEAHAR